MRCGPPVGVIGLNHHTCILHDTGAAIHHQDIVLDSDRCALNGEGRSLYREISSDGEVPRLTESHPGVRVVVIIEQQRTPLGDP